MNAPASPLDVAVVAFGSPVRMRILQAVAQSPGATAHELSTTLEMPRSTVSASVLLLEEVGLLLPSDTSEDRRGRRLRYTVDHDAYRGLIQGLSDLLPA